MPRPNKVFLGYEDEVLGVRRLSKINYTFDKIGGLPNWPPLENLEFSTKCPLCSLHRLLVVQLNASIPNNIYNRTLYVFACINPNCWIQSESWTCVRVQIKSSSPEQYPATEVKPAEGIWCQGSDDWYGTDNGNDFMSVDNGFSPNNGIQRNSDDDEDESNSFDMETAQKDLCNLQLRDDDGTNANSVSMKGAEGAVGMPVAVAEIEGKDESDLVIVDTPSIPNKNIEHLFQQTEELPLDIRNQLTSDQLHFVAKYLYLEEEPIKPCENDERVLELLENYKKENELEMSNACAGVAGCGDGDEEMYEEAAPLHGDRLFHAFITRLRRNPEQILRYSREVPPLLGAPLTRTDNVPTVCHRCGSSVICELQLLPRFGETLRLAPNDFALPYLHFLSVLIFTCSQSCWLPTDTLFKETVVFQPEI